MEEEAVLLGECAKKDENIFQPQKIPLHEVKMLNWMLPYFKDPVDNGIQCWPYEASRCYHEQGVLEIASRS